MADESGRDADNGEHRENDNNMDVRSDIEGQMQGLGVMEAIGNRRCCRSMWLERVDEDGLVTWREKMRKTLQGCEFFQKR